MTRQELRAFLDEWFCGCGSPEEASGALLRLLRLHPAFDHQEELKALIPDDGVRYLTLYTLDRYGLTEHGGSVGGAWLTDKGTAVRDALAREEADGFEALSESHCVHGSFDEMECPVLGGGYLCGSADCLAYGCVEERDVSLLAAVKHAYEALTTAGEIHNCDYCRADAAAMRRALEETKGGGRERPSE